MIFPCHGLDSIIAVVAAATETTFMTVKIVLLRCSSTKMDSTVVVTILNHRQHYIINGKNKRNDDSQQGFVFSRLHLRSSLHLHTSSFDTGQTAKIQTAAQRPPQKDSSTSPRFF